MAVQFHVLDQLELLEFFGAEPVARSLDDGYWCYEVSDKRGVMLRFSFNLYERSVQTSLLLAGVPLAIVSHEGADRMVIREGKLRCEFTTAGEKATLDVEVSGSLSVAWSSLRTE
jgi:hypothetical protein